MRKYGTCNGGSMQCTGDSIDSPVDYAEVESYAKLDRLLDNGLSEEENRRLFHSVNIMEIVSLILKGISNVIN